MRQRQQQQQQQQRGLTTATCEHVQCTLRLSRKYTSHGDF